MNPSVNSFTRPATYSASFIAKVSQALPNDRAIIEDLEAGAKFCVGYVLKEKSPELYREWQTILGIKPDPLPKETKPAELAVPQPKKEDKKFIRLTKNTPIYKRDGMFLRRDKGLRAGSLVGIGEREWAYFGGKDNWAIPFTMHNDTFYFLERELEYQDVKEKKS